MSRMNEREKALKCVQQLDFIRDDIGLFLNTHPDCEEAFRAFKYYTEAEREAREEYEKCYGPLSLAGVDRCGGYDWINHAWPWEVEA